MSDDPKRNRARELAAEYVARGDALGWFEPLYAEAAGVAQRVPWADLRPNPNLVEWLDREAVKGASRSALVVGCGLGDDAECLAERGFCITAFDIAPTAINWCRKRFPASKVAYEIADLLKARVDWTRAFDLIVETYTFQVLPPDLRKIAMKNLAEWVRPGGMLVVICRGRKPEDSEGQMPWPLLRTELSVLEQSGLTAVDFEEYWDRHEEPAVLRFRGCYSRSHDERK